MSKNYIDPKRYQQSLFTPIEKRALLWLARHMPDRVNSDHLTVLGFAGMIIAGAGYFLSATTVNALFIATFGLAVNWFGDSLDGTLARLRNRQRPRYGFYVDHIIDSFGALFLLGGLSLSPFMTPSLAIALLVVYLLFSIDLYLATFTIGTFRLSFWIFGPTELRILMAAGNMTLFFHPYVSLFGTRMRLFDAGGIVALTGLAAVLISSVIRNASLLYRTERF